MKKIMRFTLCLIALVLSGQCAMAQFNWPYKIVNGVIIPETPERPAGQKDALNLVTPKLKVVHVAFVGLGMRGGSVMDCWTNIDGIQITALCDYDKDRAYYSNDILARASLPPAKYYYGEDGYKEMCKQKDIDLVYIATDWLHHFPVAKCALENGKNVAIEVPSAMNLHEIWELINLAETKRLHCMLLENCCYGEFEMNTLTMAQKGVFGEIVHAQGGYIHNLDPYWPQYWKKDANDKLGWRLEYNKNFRGDVYPTHGLGPIAQLMNIHRGDRFKTMIAMDTKAFNGPVKVEKATGQPCTEFKNGDHTTTLIRTENGKVIEVQHDVMDPQPYSRLYQIIGTEGMANQYPIEGYAMTKEHLQSLGIEPKNPVDFENFMPNDERKALEEKYMNPIIRKIGAQAKIVGGHGGMDFIEGARLVYCLQHGLPLDIDIYDLAEWCCLAELGAMSMDNGNLPVAVPDFTRGHWRDIKGFSYAFASPEEEEAVAKSSAEFTKKLKEKGKKYKDEYDKKYKK